MNKTQISYLGALIGATIATNVGANAVPISVAYINSTPLTAGQLGAFAPHFAAQHLPYEINADIATAGSFRDSITFKANVTSLYELGVSNFTFATVTIQGSWFPTTTIAGGAAFFFQAVIASGIYTVTVTGANETKNGMPIIGQAVATIIDPSLATPLPGTLFLFGSVVVGVAALMRRINNIAEA